MQWCKVADPPRGLSVGLSGGRAGVSACETSVLGVSGKRLGSHFPLLWCRWFFFFGFDYLIDFVEIFVWLFGFVLFLIERWDFSSMW